MLYPKLFQVFITLSIVTLLSCGNDPEPPDSNDSASSAVRTPECIASTEALEAMYEDLRLCQEDRDCVYVDGFYEIIPRRDRNEFVRTWDCNAFSPFLVVTNEERLKENFEDVKALQGKTETLCRPQGDVVTCQAFDGFESLIPPTCEEGRCRPHPPPSH